MLKNKILLGTTLLSIISLSTYRLNKENFTNTLNETIINERTNIKRADELQKYTNSTSYEYLNNKNIVAQDKVRHSSSGQSSIMFLYITTGSFNNNIQMNFYFRGDVRNKRATDDNYFLYGHSLDDNGKNYISSFSYYQTEGTFEEFAADLQANLQQRHEDGNYTAKFYCKLLYNEQLDQSVFTILVSNVKNKFNIRDLYLTYGYENKDDSVCENISINGTTQTNLDNLTYPEYQFYKYGDYGIKSVLTKDVDGFYLEEDQTAVYNLSFLVQQVYVQHIDNDKAKNVKLIDSGGYTGFAKPGEYTLKFLITDDENNIDPYIELLKIKVKDVKAPTFSLVNNYLKIPYYEQDKRKIIEDNLVVSDDSTIALLTFDYDINDLVNVGVKDINVSAKDVYDNSSTYSYQIEIVDDRGPNIIGYDLIRTTKNNVLTEKDIINQYKAIDELTGECKITIFDDEYHKDNNSTKVGTYGLTINSADSNNNAASKKVFIEVVDEEDESLYLISNGKLTIKQGYSLNFDELVNKMRYLGYLPSDATYTNCLRLEGYEIDGTNDLGKFNLKLQLNKNNNEFDVLNVEVEIVDSTNLNSDSSNNNSNDNEQENVIYSKNVFIRFFQKVFAKIKFFFVGMFKK